ncbi:hypothetical protein OROMI_019208 [Orobanche minor]
MAEGSTSQGFAKSRPVLGDITNLLGKRGSFERETNKILDDFDHNDENQAKRIRFSNYENRDTNAWQFCRQAASKSSNDVVTVFSDCVIGNSKVRIGNNKVDVDNDTLLNMKINFKGPNPLDTITIENEVSKIIHSKFDSLKESKGKQLIDLDSENIFEYVDMDIFHDHRRKNLDGDESKVIPEHSQSYVNEYHDGDGDFGNLVSSQCGSIDGTFVPESQESKVVAADKGNECGYIGEGTDSIKCCSCTFCTKAGYIWLDLNYQDIKARVSALKKSQKEANIQAESVIRRKGIEKHSAESFSDVSKLESDMMYQWRFLFQHMADVVGHESNQLEARLLPLNDLRDKCRMDLESIGVAWSEKH